MPHFIGGSKESLRRFVRFSRIMVEWGEISNCSLAVCFIPSELNVLRAFTGAHIGAPLPPIYYDVPIKFYRGRGAPACAPANEKNVTFCPSNSSINPNLKTCKKKSHTEHSPVWDNSYSFSMSLARISSMVTVPPFTYFLTGPQSTTVSPTRGGSVRPS